MASSTCLRALERQFIQVAPTNYASPLLPFLIPAVQCRYASSAGPSAAAKAREKQEQLKRKKEMKFFHREKFPTEEKFALCDAMRYLRAFEVGQDCNQVKYDLAISLQSMRSGPVVRNRIRLPHTVDSSQRVAVICTPDSPLAAAARKAGATLVGEDVIFDAVRNGRIEFERLICHIDSADKLAKANLGRTLGPKGLMPSPKMGTITRDVGAVVTSMIGGSSYRERVGVVRLAVGRLGFSPEQLRDNISKLMANIKVDMSRIEDTFRKEINDVVRMEATIHIENIFG